jgi:flagellar basal-body rod protein FlgC
MGLFDAINIAGSGLSAERLRMDVTAENLANAQSTRGRTASRTAARRSSSSRPTAPASTARCGRPWAARRAGIASGARGVQVVGIAEDQTPNRQIYDPGHPDANAQGYVEMPNVDSVTEMVDLISASRAYEANVTAMQTAKQMFVKTLDLLR